MHYNDLCRTYAQIQYQTYLTESLGLLQNDHRSARQEVVQSDDRVLSRSRAFVFLAI